MNYIITQEQLNTVMKYMFTRPYQEVAQGIAVLSKLPKLDDKINGVIVTEVDPNGPASTKGISPGDRIIQVSQQDVSTPSDVVRLVKIAKKEKQRSVLFRIQSQARLRFVAIRIDQN